MAANLDRPKIVIPTGCPNGGVMVGTGSAVEVHQLVSGTEEVDAVTIEAWCFTLSQTVTITWPSTTGGTASIPVDITLDQGPQTIIDRWTGNGGGSITVSGAASTAFKVGVERYPVNKNEPDTKP